MKSALVLAIAIVSVMPVVSVPTVADAQVLTRRSTPARRAPPRLTEAEVLAPAALRSRMRDAALRLAALYRD